MAQNNTNESKQNDNNNPNRMTLSNNPNYHYSSGVKTSHKIFVLCTVSGGKPIYVWQCHCPPGPEENVIETNNWHPLFIMRCPVCSIGFPINSEDDKYASFRDAEGYPTPITDSYSSRYTEHQPPFKDNDNPNNENNEDNSRVVVQFTVRRSNNNKENGTIVYLWLCACNPGSASDFLNRKNWQPFYCVQCPSCTMAWPIDDENKNEEWIQFGFRSAYPSHINSAYDSRNPDDDDENKNDDNEDNADNDQDNNNNNNNKTGKDEEDDEE